MHLGQNKEKLGKKSLDIIWVTSLDMGDEMGHDSQHLYRKLYARGGGLGSSTIFKKFNEPYAPCKWYSTTGRRAH